MIPNRFDFRPPPARHTFARLYRRQSKGREMKRGAADYR